MTVYSGRVDFHFDVMCPFAFHASRWVREVREQVGIDIGWRFFSLEEVNRGQGEPHPWEQDWSFGWPLLRIGALLRRQSMALCDSWYERTGTALHIEGRKPHERHTARVLLQEIGCEPAVLDEALADESTNEEVRADHERVMEAGGFGVPTMFFEDGQSLFGPVMVNPPTGRRATALWESFTSVLQFPEIHEIKRPRGPAQQQEIADGLAVYLAARDWVSIDRGQVVEFNAPA